MVPSVKFRSLCVLLVLTFPVYAASQISTTKKGHEQQQNVVKFYTPDLKLIYSLTVPGKVLNGISWEGMGQLIAIGKSAIVFLL